MPFMENKNRYLIRLAVIAGIIASAFAWGFFAGKIETVQQIFGAIGLVMLGIMVLVTIHELGHFLAAKAFGMRVETFSIGFPPTLFSFKRGGTDYEIGATPLGGYVKISGMIDESLDSETMSKPPEPWEFRSKPIWQRIIVMVAGVFMNVVLGILIFSMVAFARGEQRTPVSEAKYGIQVIKSIPGVDKCGAPLEKTSLGYLVGFRSGDKLLSYMGTPMTYLEEYLDPGKLLADNAYFEVARNGEKVKLEVPQSVLKSFSNDTVVRSLFSLNQPAIVNVREKSAGANAGLKSGDEILSIAGHPVSLYSDLLDILPGRANQQIGIAVLRGSDTLDLTVQLDSTSKLGVEPDTTFMSGIKFETINYGFFESFKPGFKEAFGILSLNVKGFERIAQGRADASKSVMGPVAIAKQFWETYQRVGWVGVLLLTASLSMILAFVNILPIPALDGGHVIVLLIEAVIRRELSVKVRIIIQQIGMVLLLGLMVLVIFNDFLTHIFNTCP